MSRIALRRLVFAAVPATLLLVANLFGTSLMAESDRPDPSLPSGPFALRVYYDEIRDIRQLQSYDLWEFNNLNEKYVLVGADQHVFRTLRDDGWRVSLDAEATASLQHPTASTRFSGGYRTVDQLYDEVAEKAEAFPDLVELVDYGDSYCKGQGGCVTLGGENLPGYDLLAVRITNEAIAGSSDITESGVTMGSKPVFFLMANIHAREITTPELAMRLIDQLLAEYNQDADITWMVDHHEIWVVPTVNPDGHWLVELGDHPKYGGYPFYQRKNANNDADADNDPDCPQWPPATFAQQGIDLNRNHSFGWGPIGSSNQPCNLTFRGPSPASEPEVAQLQALVSSLIPDQRGDALTDAAPADTTGLLITLHSYSNLVLWPWGNTTQLAPNRADLKAIGDRLSLFNGYISCQPSYCLYDTSGTTDDWAYGELGIPAFTFEVGDEFMPPYQEIDNVQWPDNGPALLYAAGIARTPYATIRGPEVRDIAISQVRSVVTLDLVVDDTFNGGKAIAAVEYVVDRPFWDAAAQPLAMSPSDGTFDSVTEDAQVVFDTLGLTDGRHILFARGQDSDGNWGPVSAAFFDVTDGIDAQRLYLPALARP